MKFLSLIFLAAFLLIGCQTNKTLSKSVSLSTTTEDGTVIIESNPKSPHDPSDPEIIQLSKPVICGNSAQLVRSLMDKAGEQPVMMWETENKANKIVVMMNKESKTVTVLEWPKSPSRPGLVCFLSTGVDAVFEF